MEETQLLLIYVDNQQVAHYLEGVGELAQDVVSDGDILDFDSTQVDEIDKAGLYVYEATVSPLGAWNGTIRYASFDDLSMFRLTSGTNGLIECLDD